MFTYTIYNILYVCEVNEVRPCHEGKDPRQSIELRGLVTTHIMCDVTNDEWEWRIFTMRRLRWHQ